MGPGGRIFALDLNPQMLDRARTNCKEWAGCIEFMEGSADRIELPDNSISRIVCQQGFQFFPDKEKVAEEIYRVLKANGSAILSTWCSVEECQIFGMICEALESIGENGISDMMRVPFDFLSLEDLMEPFKNAGFSRLDISTQEQYLCLEGGIKSAISFVYATPIGPSLLNLDDEKQEAFESKFLMDLHRMFKRKGTYGQMVTNILKVGF
jgi:ubiquinone/menaquinone biosynthesis C-methylase UbiE